MNDHYFMSTLLAAALAALSTIAMADSMRSAQYEKCTDKISDGIYQQAQLLNCINEELERQDLVLNEEYWKLRDLLSDEQKNLLITAQRAWLKYREAWCRFDENGLNAPGGAINYSLCLMEMTDAQIKLIRFQQY